MDKMEAALRAEIEWHREMIKVEEKHKIHEWEDRVKMRRIQIGRNEMALSAHGADVQRMAELTVNAMFYHNPWPELTDDERAKCRETAAAILGIAASPDAPR